MYRCWKESDQPRECGHPARATAKVAALKRDEPVGEVYKSARWKTIGHIKKLGGQ
jgi:hypothetical protein